MIMSLTLLLHNVSSLLKMFIEILSKIAGGYGNLYLQGFITQHTVIGCIISCVRISEQHV